MLTTRHTAQNKVMIIETDQVFRQFLHKVIRDHGFEVVNDDGVPRGPLEIPQVAHILLMTAEAPQIDVSLSFTKQLRDQSNIGIVLMHDGADPDRRRAALDAGADDLLPRPPEPGELGARLRNISWRLGHTTPVLQTAPKLEMGEWILDRATRTLMHHDGIQERLTGGESRIMEALISHAGQMISRHSLTRALNGREANPRDRTVDVLIGRLRRKLRDDPRVPQLITTVHGGGYVFTVKPRPVS